MDDSLGPRGDAAVEIGPGVEAAFSLLADETRLAILETLYVAGEPLAFSELRERVGTRDSGQFNYHLGRLVGQFVDETGDGYELSTGARYVLGAVFAGEYDDESATVDPIPVEGDCPKCDGALAAGYEDELMSVECRECETRVFAYPAPPGILHGREREALPYVFAWYARTIIRQVADGVCPVCLGPTEPDLDTVTAADHLADAESLPDSDDPGIDFVCGRCGGDYSVTLGVAALDHPDVRQFALDHGIDPMTEPLWTLSFLLEARERRIAGGADDGAVAETRLPLEGEALVVRFDGDLDVVGTRRD